MRELGKTIPRDFTRDDIEIINKGLAKGYEFKTPKGKVAQGEKAQRRAANLDETIQSKVNRGIELTPEQKMYQRRAMSNLGLNE